MVSCGKEASKKAIIKTAMIAKSGMKEVSIGLLFCLWFNNNAPITSLVWTFVNQNSHTPKALDIFFYSAFSYTNLVGHIISCDWRIWNNEVDYLLCSFTDFLLCFRCISELIRIYTELFDRTFFIYTELFCVYTELFDRTFFVYRILFEGTIYPVGYFFNRYSAVLTPVQIIECGVERSRFRLILRLFSLQEIR